MVFEFVLPAVISIVALLATYRAIKLRNGSSREVEPIAEAEVYLAYGRKAQAIAVLEKAELDHPNRSDIREKLNELRIKS